MHWKVDKITIKYQNRFMTVTEDELTTDHSQHVTFGIVRKEPAAVVIPWKGEKFTMIRQYRYAVDFVSWEFPAGHYEHNTIKETAQAELQEEAGLKADQIKEIGLYHIAPGHMTQVCHIFLATGLHQVERKLEKSELGMEVGEFTLAEIKQMVKDGLIKDGLTLAAILFFELYENK